MTLNAWLAAAVALLAIGAINKMNGTTNNAVRCSIVLLFGATAGQALGSWVQQWDAYLDTLVYAGMAAFLLACRRNPVGIPYPWNEVLSYVVSIGFFLFVMVTFPWGDVVLAWQVSR